MTIINAISVSKNKDTTYTFKRLNHYCTFG